MREPLCGAIFDMDGVIADEITAEDLMRLQP